MVLVYFPPVSFIFPSLSPQELRRALVGTTGKGNVWFYLVFPWFSPILPSFSASLVATFGFWGVPGMSNTPGIISPLRKASHLELILPLSRMFSLTLHISRIFPYSPQAIHKILERKYCERKVVHWTLTCGMLQARCPKKLVVIAQTAWCLRQLLVTFPAQRVSGKYRQARNSFWKG